MFGIKPSAQNSKNNTKVEKFNIESFMHPSTKHLYQSRLHQNIQNAKILPTDSVNDAWSKIETNIINSAKESIGKRVLKGNSKKSSYKPWFCDEVKMLAAEKRASY